MLREVVNLLLENNQELSNGFRTLAVMDCTRYILHLTKQATTQQDKYCVPFTVSAKQGDHDAKESCYGMALLKEICPFSKLIATCGISFSFPVNGFSSCSLYLLFPERETNSSSHWIFKLEHSTFAAQIYLQQNIGRFS